MGLTRALVLGTVMRQTRHRLRFLTWRLELFMIAPIPTDKKKAKKEFEKRKDDVLASLPEDYKDRFHSFGSVKWNRVDLPVFILSPFDIADADVRIDWLTKYEQAKKRNALDKLDYIHYWYGSGGKPGDMYGLSQRRQVKKYTPAAQKSWDKERSKIDRKVTKGTTLSAGEQNLLNALIEFEEDREEAKDEITRGFESFEKWMVLTREDIQELETAEFASDNESYVSEGSRSSAKAPKKRDDKFDAETSKKSTKRKKLTKKAAKRDSERAPATIVDDIVASAAPEDNSAGVDGDRQLHARTNATPAKKQRVKASPAPSRQRVDADVTSSKNVDDMSFAEQEGDSDEESEETRANQVAIDEDMPSDNAVDEDYDPRSNKWDQRERQDLPTTSSHTVKRQKFASTEKDTTTKEEEPNEKSLRKEYKRNVKSFEGYVEQWQTAIAGEDFDGVRNSMQRLSGHVHEMTAQFLVDYFQEPLANTKKLYQAKSLEGSDQQRLLKQLRAQVKEQHSACISKLPDRLKNVKFSVKTAIGSIESGSKPDKHAAVSGEGKAMAPAKDELRIDEDSKQPVVSNKRNQVQGPCNAAAASPARRNKIDGKGFKLANLKVQDAGASSVEPAGSGKFPRRPTQSENTRSRWYADPADSTKSTIAADELASDREFALEFLLQMADHFEDNRVCPPALALELEEAVKTHADELCAKGAYKWEDVYWKKVHAVVAAVCGREEPGTLMRMIADGKIDDPKEIANMSDDKLFACFEGKEIKL